MRNSYDLIEIDNYVILSTLKNFHVREYAIFVYRFGQKTCQPNIGKIFKTNIILNTKYVVIFIGIYCKKFNFYF